MEHTPTTQMINEITKKQTSGLNKILHTLTAEQVQILNLHCEKVQAAWDRQNAAQQTEGYWKAWQAFVYARAARTKALKKAGFTNFSTGTCYTVSF